jgi:hypothetical protein
MWIYILQLEHDKYYVGKTSNPEYRIENHNTGHGSEWTKLYKPISIIELIPNCDDFDEDKYVIMSMNKYGIDNVRGGSFSQIVLPNNTKDHLLQMTRGSQNLCFLCGSNEHFSKQCINDLDWELIEKPKCYRCGRDTHLFDRCYATYHLKGHRL